MLPNSRTADCRGAERGCCSVPWLGSIHCVLNGEQTHFVGHTVYVLTFGIINISIYKYALM